MKRLILLLATGMSLSLPVLAINFNPEAAAQMQQTAKQALVMAQTLSRIKVPSNLCLDVAGDTKIPGTNVQIFHCNDAPNQKWRYDGSARLVNEGGLCLDVAGNTKNQGTNVQVFHCHDLENQRWNWDRQGRLVNGGGLCLDAAGDVNHAGTNVHIWPCNDAPNQRWQKE